MFSVYFFLSRWPYICTLKWKFQGPSGFPKNKGDAKSIFAVQAGRFDYAKLKYCESRYWLFLVVSPHSAFISTIKVYCYFGNSATLLDLATIWVQPSYSKSSIMSIPQTPVFPASERFYFFVHFFLNRQQIVWKWMTENNIVKNDLSIMYIFWESCTGC